MRCAKCPLFTSWNTENDRGEACGSFGDDCDAPFLYLDKKGNIAGCYIDRHFIEHRAAEYDEEFERRVRYFLEEVKKREAGKPF